MKLRIKSIIMVLFTGSVLSAQQIGEGYAPATIANFSAPLKSGIYNGLNTSTIGMAPDNSNVWQHLFVARHIGTTNNYQLQLASSFAINDRLFFRKIVANDLSAPNTNWVELATRGLNNFIGDQNITGGVISSGSGDTGGYLSLINNAKVSNSIAKKWVIHNMTGNYGNSLQFWAYDNSGCGGGLCNNRFTIMDNGNVGIGIMIPKNKLDVNGIIHSQEVKVDMNDWSDFVFKKEYNLPTLEEVEKHIKEKGHLENIPNEKEVLENGISLGKMNAKLLQKIEELTLYVIEQNKKITDLQNRLVKVEPRSN